MRASETEGPIHRNGHAKWLRDNRAMGPHGSHGIPWDPMGSHGVPWDPMGSQGIPWDPMGSHGVPWGPMGSHGLPWAPMGSHGTPWGPMARLSLNLFAWPLRWIGPSVSDALTSMLHGLHWLDSRSTNQVFHDKRPAIASLHVLDTSNSSQSGC